MNLHSSTYHDSQQTQPTFQQSQQQPQQPTPEELLDFKTKVRKFKEVDDAIRMQMQQTRALRKTKSSLSNEISAFMGRYMYQQIKLEGSNQVLSFRMSYTNTPLPQSIIRERVEQVLQQEAPAKCMEMTATVFRREIVPRPSLSLRRVKVQ